MINAAENRVALPLLRGSAEGAECESCPLSVNGAPNRPVFSEYPEKPAWILIGEGPGFNEVRMSRPFVGASGEVVMKLLGRIQRSREDLYISNATLCQPPMGASEEVRSHAAVACKTRLQLELAQFPGVPILTLGAVAARSVIPKPALDAIDPPDVPESKQKRQKRRQRSENDERHKREQKLGKIERRLLREIFGYRRKQIFGEVVRRYKRKPDRAYLDREVEKDRKRLEIRARQDAEKELAAREAAKAAKPKKKKPIKISDIVGTCFDVDVDGTGVRAVIPAIHPAALLRGGGKSIAGSHTPDLAYINLMYDFGKIDALAKGHDVRLHVNVEIEGEDPERATWLFVSALQAGLDEGEISLDLETYVDDPDRHHALMAYMARIRAMGIATKHRAISVLWDLVAPWAQSYFQLVLASVRARVITHNGLYDRTVLRTNGFEVNDDNYEDCYVDSETEFLTTRGWLRYDDVRAGVKLATLDRNGRLEWQDFYRRVSKPFSGVAHVFETRGTRAVVTGNHRMWCQPLTRSARAWRGRPRGPWQFIPAEKMSRSETDSFAIYQTCTPPIAGVAPDRAWLELVGLWLADGSLGYFRGRPSYVVISQKKDGRASGLLKRLATRFKFRVHENSRKESWRKTPCIEQTWALWDPPLAVYLESLGRYSRMRRLPEEAFSWDVASRRTFLEALFLGDGSQYGGRLNRFTYRSGSRALADGVQALAISIGWGAITSSYCPGGIHHVLILRQANTTTPLRARTSGKNAHISLQQIDQDRIVCFSVPNETLITRSRGKPAFYGNTLYGHHSAFPGCAHGLQVVTTQFYATSPWKSEFRLAEENTEKLLIYNAKDTGATHQIHPSIQIIVRKNKNERTYAIDRKMAECASRMHLRGMPVSREINTELLTTFTKNVAESREQVESVAQNPELREQIWHYLAFEQAKTQRKADHADFEARYHARLKDIRDDDARGKWRWKISGGKHVAALIQALGVQLQQVTASGNISTKKDILEGLVNVPVIRDLLTFRENDKLLSTFVWQVFDRFVDGQMIQTGFADGDDRIHPIWNVHKISGRWASYEPVVSNVPKSKWKKQPDGTMKMIRPNLRRQIHTRKGRTLVGFDFAQLEARNLALISGDEFLLSVFARGGDIHTECSRVVFSGAGGTTPFDMLDPIAGVTSPSGIVVVTPCEYCQRIDFHHEKCKLAKMKKQLRDLVKQVEYGAFYGGSPETLWKVLLKEGFNVQLSDVAGAIAKLMQKMSGIVRWQRQTVAKASLPPHTITDFVLGRRRVFPMGQVDPNEALNFESQATAAAIMDTGMARMEERIGNYKDAYAIVQVHDAAAYECDEDDAEAIAADITECYTQEYERDGHVVPYPVDVKIATSWDRV